MKSSKMSTILVLALGLMVWSGEEALGGTLVAWGGNDYGQCDVPAGSFAAIAAGGGHSLALKSDGTLAAWGRNDYGQCDVPVGSFVAIAAGGRHNLALKSDGSLAAWGYNISGQCDVPAGNDFVAIAGGLYHSLALKSDGSLAAWGYNAFGQCNVPAGNDFVAIAGGFFHSLALKSDGSLAAWGIDDGSTWDYGQVTDVPAGNNFVAVAAGGYHSLALKSDGSLAAWGLNNYGQRNVPTGNDFVAVAAGGSHSLALKSDGSLAGWGYNTYGQCNVPAGSFVSIAAGGSHNLAIAAALMGTAFTYQGRLLNEGSPAEGLYDFEFKLYNANVAGVQKGSTIDINELDVIDGYFTAALDFDANVFTGDARWLEIGVRPGELNDPNAYIVLSPRQEVTPTPYAIYAQTAGGDNDWMVSDNNMYSIPSGNVGIGTDSPAAKLHAVTGDSFGTGVCGQAPFYGGYFEASGKNGRGVGGSGAIWGGYFEAAGSSGTNYGVYGKTNSSSGYAGYFVGRGYFSGNVGIGTTDPCTAKLAVMGGHVGIGTTNPHDLLHVWRDTSGSLGIRLTNADSGGGDYALRVGGSTSAVGAGNFAIYDHNASATRLVVDSSGNVGIGTTSPEAKLHVQDGAILLDNNRYLRAKDSGGTPKNILGMHDDTVTLSNWAGGDIRFVIGTPPMAAQRLIVQPYGTVGVKVGIGVADPSYNLQVFGDIAYTGNIYDISDLRLKENITPLENALEKVSCLHSIYFNNKDESPDKREVGVIAQDVETVLPELVSTGNRGYKWVDYTQLTAVLVEAVKELKAENETLKQRLEALEIKVQRNEVSSDKEVQL